MSNVGVACIKWGIKPSVTSELMYSSLSVEECADFVVEKIKNGDIVSEYIYSVVYNGGFSINEVKATLLKIANQDRLGLREAFNYAGGR